MSVQDPEQLKLIKVGDQVKAVYTQALALAVEAGEEVKLPRRRSQAGAARLAYQRSSTHTVAHA